MDNQELMRRLAALPEPDFLHSNKLSDPLGSNTSYRASTVVRLIEQAVQAERERAARVCDDEARIRTEAGQQHPSESEAQGRCFAGARAAINCATGIRNGEEI